MPDEPDIVNLDDCPTKPALMVGSTIAFVLTLFPMTYALCCLPLVIGGFAATTTFVFKYNVRVELKYGMKIAILACLLGSGASTLLYDLLWIGFDYQIGMDTMLELMSGLTESENELLSELARKLIASYQNQTIGAMVVVQQILNIFLASGIGGAIGGALATAFFKRGAIAQ